MPKWLERRLALPPDKLRRLTQLVALSATIGAANVLGISLAESVFLANAHQDRLPLFYVLLAITSIPIAMAFSRLVDRFRTPVIFRYLLLSCAALVILLQISLSWGALPVYFGMYIGLSVIEMLLDIIFWVLISGYFTSLEMKRYATVVVAAMAIGGLLGGGAAFLLSDLRHVSTARLLLILPILYGAAIAQLAYLERTQKEIGAGDADEEAEGSLLESLKSFPPLLRRYPMVLLLVANVFLVAVIQRITDYQVFSIYEDTYKSEAALTGFLGLLNALLNVLEAVITFLVTRPLIQRLGVGGMNLVYPVTTITSFVGLAVPQLSQGAARFELASAIGGHVNYETLFNSLAQPVETLNYNAVPRRFLGRVRVLNDGLIYPAGAALAGLLLLAVEKFEVPALRLSLAGVGLGVVFLGLGYLLSRGYLKSLVEMLRSRAVNLDDVGEGLSRLPARYAEEARQLLTSDDPTAQQLGVQLASRMDPTLFLPELEALLTRADASMHRSIVKLYAAVHQQDTTKRVRAMLRSENDALRQVALEALIASGERLESDELSALLADPNLVIRALACVAVRQAGSAGAAFESAAAGILRSEMTAAAREAIVRAIHNAVEGERGRAPGTSHRELAALLEEVLREAEAPVKSEALKTLAALAPPEDPRLFELASAELTHPEAEVRVAAYEVLAKIQTEAAIAKVAAGLEDSDKMVRERVAIALATQGERALPLAAELLKSARPECVDAAIAVIGGVRTQRAEDKLFEFMKTQYLQVAQNLRWLERVPGGSAAWRAVRVGIEDSNDRIIRRVLHVLSSLGHERILNCVRRIMHSRDARLRADAVETLSSLSHRRFVEPVLPLLERQAERDATPRADENVGKADKNLLPEILQSPDRWIRIGGMAVISASQSPVPADWVTNSSDPLVQEALFHTLLVKADAAAGSAGATARAAAESGQQDRAIQQKEVFAMNRIMFLRETPLFQYLALDDLLIIDAALASEEFLAGETIFTEGSLGSDFYIVFRGTVLIQKKLGAGEQELARLSPGECFGEMALFDDSPRSATAVSKTDCTLLTLERSRFSSLLTQRPEMGLEICRVLSLRLRAANERLGTQAQAAH
jgi:HEAT repeat protein